MTLIQSNSFRSRQPAGRRILGAAIALALAAIPGHARADQLFVAVNNGFNGFAAIGEYNLDGTAVNRNLFTSLYGPEQMVVSGTNLFVVDGSSNGSIGEYSTSGATVNPSLITGLPGVTGIALSGTNLFVCTVGNGTAGAGAVGEYSTSGATVNAALITGLDYPTGISVSGTNLFVTINGSGPNTGVIGEYSTSGATVNATLVSGLNAPLTPLVSGTNLFVIINSSTIAEYTTSGAAVNTTLISGLGGGAQSLAINGSELFVNERNSENGVGEYTLGATPGTVLSTNTTLITGLYEPNSVLVDVTPPAVSLGFYPTLTITGVVGDSYSIQSSTNLANPSAWVTQTNLTLTQPSEIWVDTSVNTSWPSTPRSFYQVLPAQ